MKICPSCRAEMPDEMLFCTSCGAKLSGEEKTCPNCGALNLDGAQFCAQCGASFVPMQQPVPQLMQQPVWQAPVMPGVISPEEKLENDYAVVKNSLSGELNYDELNAAMKRLEALGDYRDAPELLYECREKVTAIGYERACEKYEAAKENNSLYKELEKEFAALGNYKDAEKKYQECKAFCDAQRQKNKKKAIIAVSAAVAVIAAAVILIKVVIPSVTYNNAEKALEEGNYEEAIAGYEKLGDYKDASEHVKDAYFGLGKKLVAEESFDEAVAAFENAAGVENAEKYVQYAKGRGHLAAGEYKDAISCFTAVKEIEDSAQRLLEANYLYGEKLLKDAKYSDAKLYYTAAGSYQDAKKKVNVCSLMQAEEEYKKGNLSQAKNAFAAIPADTSYNGVSAKERLQTLEKSSGLIAICGKWKATKNYIESRNVYKRTGSWDSWYIDVPQSGQDLTIQCIPNNKGTFTIKGSVSFYRFTNYSSLSSLCNATITTKSFSIENASQMPSSYQIDGDTTLTYSNGVFSISYSRKDNYSAYFYNKYSTTVTYGSRA